MKSILGFKAKANSMVSCQLNMYSRYCKETEELSSTQTARDIRMDRISFFICP